MRVLIACEESQAVCKEFRKRGHEAYSCDIQECSGGHPEWHIQGDVLKAIKGGTFITQDGKKRLTLRWDMMIAFPPCTHLTVSGARWFPEKRKDGRQRDGINFFMKMINAPINKIAVENPVGIISGGNYLKTHFPDLVEKYKLPIPYTQAIQPFYFGDEARKTTCLWLKNLPLLFHANKIDLFNDKITYVGEGEIHEFKSGRRMAKWIYENWGNAYELSKTFPGIAKAMAEQWSENLLA